MKMSNFKFQVTVNLGCKAFSYENEKKGGRKHIESMEGLDLAVGFDVELEELNVEGKEMAEVLDGFAKAISETTRAEADKAFAQARARADEARARSEIRMREDEEWCKRHTSES